MIRPYMTALTLGSLVVGALAVSPMAVAQADRPRDGHRGGPMAMADANKDGVVTRDELTQALTARFARMDINGDGKVTKEERTTRRTAHDDARFARIDSDGNGQISKAEFAAGHDGDRRGPKRAHRGERPDGSAHKGGGFGPRAAAEKDGVLTREAMLAGPLARFDKADANKDGRVTAAEQQAARSAMRVEWQARHADAVQK